MYHRCSVGGSGKNLDIVLRLKELLNHDDHLGKILDQDSDFVGGVGVVGKWS